MVIHMNGRYSMNYLPYRRTNHGIIYLTQRHTVCTNLLLIFLFIYFEPCDWESISDQRNSFTMGCPPVRGDNPRALASGLSYV